MEERKMTRSNQGLPNISDLFAESWQYLKQSILHIFIFSLIGWVVMCIAIILFIIILAIGGVGASTLFKGGMPNIQTLAPIITLATLVGVILLFVVIFTSIQVQIGTILSIKHSTDKTPFGELFKNSFKFILPLFVLQIIVSFLSFGGFFVFIIPSFLFSFFFIFSAFVYLTTENTGILDSMRRSMALVLSHFWGLLGRFLLWILMVIIVVVCMHLIFKNSGMGSIVSGILQTILGWFGTVYTYVLFIHAQKSVDAQKKSSLLWPTIVAIIGCIIGILFVIGMVFAFAQLSKSGAFDQIKKEIAAESSKTNTKKSNSPANIFIESGNEKINQAISLSQSQNITQAQREQISSLLQDGIIDLKKATQTDPKNYDAWMALGFAYRNLSGLSPEAGQFVLSSYNKAIEIDPTNPEAFIQLGGYYYQKEQYPTAITYFQKATEVAPQNVNAWYNLGITYKQQGQTTQAQAAFQKALNLLPANSPDRATIQQEMK